MSLYSYLLLHKKAEMIVRGNISHIFINQTPEVVQQIIDNPGVPTFDQIVRYTDQGMEGTVKNHLVHQFNVIDFVQRLEHPELTDWIFDAETNNTYYVNATIYPDRKDCVAALGKDYVDMLDKMNQEMVDKAQDDYTGDAPEVCTLYALSKLGLRKGKPEHVYNVTKQNGLWHLEPAFKG